jgi:hypothetical protein
MNNKRVTVSRINGRKTIGVACEIKHSVETSDNLISLTMPPKPVKKALKVEEFFPTDDIC